GNRAVCYIISAAALEVPRYIRLGKFMSKARVAVEELHAERQPEVRTTIPFLLNPADMPPEVRLLPLDIINVPPVPLVRNAQVSGPCYHIGRNLYLPVGMRFGVDQL